MAVRLKKLAGRDKPPEMNGSQAERQLVEGLLQPPLGLAIKPTAEGTCGTRRPTRLPLAFCMFGD